MADVVVVAALDRTELGDPDLNIHASPYEVFAVGIGGRVWKHRSVDNDWIHGELRTASTLQNYEAVVGIRTKSTTIANVAAAIAVLVEGFSQRSYELTGSLDGVAFSFVDCWPADMTEVKLLRQDEGVDQFQLMAKQYHHRFIFRCDPAASVWPF